MKVKTNGKNMLAKIRRKKNKSKINGRSKATKKQMMNRKAKAGGQTKSKGSRSSKEKSDSNNQKEQIIDDGLILEKCLEEKSKDRTRFTKD